MVDKQMKMLEDFITLIKTGHDGPLSVSRSMFFIATASSLTKLLNIFTEVPIIG